ncbi:MAG: SRPBCC family protein [Clostridia bacterium]|nr:SRPBCC family protein [Clostridia bacterium]
MIQLQDSVEIDVPLERLYEWLNELDRNFVPWSPPHEYFYKITGGFDVGDQIQFKELVMGVPYDIKGVIKQHDKSENGFHIMFETMSGLSHIHFIGERTQTGCRFTHAEDFGKPDTFFGRIFNWALFEVIAKKKANWKLILDDMKEDNLYLKEILETGTYPPKTA